MEVEYRLDPESQANHQLLPVLSQRRKMSTEPKSIYFSWFFFLSFNAELEESDIDSVSNGNAMIHW